MRKTVTIVVILLLGAILIGWERLSNGGASSGGGAAVAASIPANHESVRRETKSRRPEKPQAAPVERLIAEASAPEVPNAANSAPLLDAPPLGNRPVLPELTVDFNFLRSRAILGDAPDAESRALLIKAVAEAERSSAGPVRILDLDGFSTSQTPFVSYANPRYDVTPIVKAVFDRLKDEAARLAQSSGSR